MLPFQITFFRRDCDLQDMFLSLRRIFFIKRRITGILENRSENRKCVSSLDVVLVLNGLVTWLFGPQIRIGTKKAFGSVWYFGLVFAKSATEGLAMQILDGVTGSESIRSDSL